jgi:hypothetical protein
VTALGIRAAVLFERSGIVRRRLRARGVEAYSFDMEPAEDDATYHVQGDWRLALGQRWDLVIAHPPCTYLCSSGLHWNTRRPGRAALTEAAIETVREVLSMPAGHLALENPVGAIGTRIRPADQYVHPWQFGDDASKRTGLWLRDLPPLRPTALVAPRMVNGRPRWGNQTDSGQNRLGPSDARSMERARTYTGIADAMVTQWLPVVAGTGVPV